MFSMKKELRIFMMAWLLLLVGGVQVKAQNWRNAPQFHLGVRAGFSVSDLADEWWNDDDDYGASLTAPMAGIAFDTKVAKIPFYVETGLYYMNRGFKFDNIWVGGEYKVTRETENNHSLLVPALISYHAYINKDMSFQPFMGPYLSYGFGSKQFDYGWRFGCGFNAKQLYVNMGVDLGITDNFDAPYSRTDAFFMTVGWNFLGKK